jgi:hypothetical protein
VEVGEVVMNSFELQPKESAKSFAAFSTKGRISALGILAALALVAIVWHRTRSDDLVLQFVDKETGKPMSNLKVTIDQCDRVPVLYKYDVLPWSMRQRFSSWTTKSGNDGSVRTRRMASDGPYPQSHIAWSHFVIEVGGGRKLDFRYEGGNFHVRRWIGIGSPPALDLLIPVPREGTLVIPVDPAWVR